MTKRRSTPVRGAALALTLAVMAAGTTACGSSAEEQDAAVTAATQVVQDFGQRLRMVSVLAPPEQLSESLQDHYGPYVTTLLLGGWLSDPASAPGRQTSSPWPARIEVQDARPIGDSAVDIEAEVVYVTGIDPESVEDVVLREPVSIRVVRGQDDAWRISEWVAR
jgi:hypothetical protein